MQAHRSDEQFGETQESPRKEAHHSPRDLSVPAIPLEHTRTTSNVTPESPPQPTKERLKWPKMSEDKE